MTRWINPSCVISRSNRSTFLVRSLITASTASGTVFSCTCHTAKSPSTRNKKFVLFPSDATTCTSLTPLLTASTKHPSNKFTRALLLISASRACSSSASSSPPPESTEILLSSRSLRNSFWAGATLSIND